MKRYLYIVILAVIVLFSNTSCQDELESNFVDPSVYTPESNIVPGMFASMMSRNRTFKNDYGEFWWHASRGGMISHLHFFTRPLRESLTYYAETNDIPATYTTMNVDSYFYGHNIDFKEIPLMKNYLDAMGDQELKDNQIYYTLANMVRVYRASKSVDMFNNVPYSEGLKGVDGNFFPKYDDAKDIYLDILNTLGTGVEQIVSEVATLSADGKRIFAQQDIIFQGDVNKWVQWGNAVRLRLAVRISGVEEGQAKSVISDIISKGNLPTEDLLIGNDSWVSKEKDHWKRGIVERDYAGFITPTLMYMLDRDYDHEYTPGVDDPRLPVLLIPNREKLYMPCSFDFSVGQKIHDAVMADNMEKYNYGSSYVYQYESYNELYPYLQYNSFSSWNPATMVVNKEPWRAFTRAEIDLLLAEVELKGLANTGKSVEEHIKNAVINSIDYWYYMNSFCTWDKITDANKSFMMPTAPTQEVKNTYAAVVAADYAKATDLESRMAVIMQQKYVHLNIHDYFELFSELRRTRLPKLGLIRYNASITINPSVERWPYPGAESSTNLESFSEVANEDNFSSYIFWVPQDKRNVSYYDTDFKEHYLYTEYPGIPESFK